MHNIYTQYIYTLHLEVSLLRLGRRGETVVTAGVIHADTGGRSVVISANMIGFRSDGIISRQTLNVAHV